MNINPPNLQYYGDRTKAESLKGVALQFYSFCCIGIGESSCLNRTKKLNDGSVIQAIINRDPYGNLNGVVRIAVNPVGPDEPLLLFCTSFNDTDLGTQVYKKPYPPITQGALIDSGDNPDYLVLPTPDFKVGNSYWVDSKEKNAISWGYVEVVISGTHYKFGKLAIQGIETSTDDWGLYYEPLAAGLITPPDDNSTQQRLLVIYRNRVNYSGTGTTRYCAVYDYELDFVNQRLNLTAVSSFNLTVAGYGSTYQIYGILDDGCKTVIYNYLTVDYADAIGFFVLADDYLSVASNGIVYEPPAPIFTSEETAPADPDNGEFATGTDTTTTENIMGSVDVRGNTVSFCIEKMVAVWVHRQAASEYGLFYMIDNHVDSNEYFTASFANGSLSRALFKSGQSSTISTATKIIGEGGQTFDGGQTVDYHLFYIDFYAKKINEVIYNEFIYSADYVLTGEYGNPLPKNLVSESSSNAVKSKLSGLLFNDTRSLSDYSYTKACVLGNMNDVSFVIDIKKKKKIVSTTTVLTDLSVTKLPEITP